MSEIWNATPHEVREAYLAYFRDRAHEERPSAPLVPENDPTLLFTGAGMNPFKDHFLGRVPLSWRRATTSQKCLRTGDLENVGRTPGHHTFFEMLGNFSFGDYFKKEAIQWAWEFLTVEMAVPRELLRVSVYEKDDEAADLWHEIAGIPHDEIARLGAKANFWPANAPEAGPNGPCGPCTEIFFDLGPGVSFGDCTVEGCPEVPAAVDCDCRRFVEIWNLVFQQYDRKDVNELEPLAMQNIDTGMGFERLLMVLAHLRTGSPGLPAEERVVWNFQTDLFAPLVEAVVALLPEGRGADPEDLVRARRISDHARGAAFCIADGVRPGNEGRGYVLRRVLRRALRDGLQMGIQEPFLWRLLEPVGKVMGIRYPDLVDGQTAIEQVIRTEEERFLQTYEQGTQRLAKAIERLEIEGSTELSGEEAFVLYDTFGFPVDVARDQLREAGMTLDEAGFETAMAAARERSREGSKIAVDIFEAGPLERVKKSEEATSFIGYGDAGRGDDGSHPWGEGLTGSSEVVEILVDDQPSDEVAKGVEARVILRETPFYAEQGGQVGDHGTLTSGDGAVFRVTDTLTVGGYHLHVGSALSGTLKRGDTVEAVVDGDRRDAVRRNHTATHLLHKALRDLLGEEATQAGSLVAPDYLRFDFNFPRALTDEERLRIEDEVNARILSNQAVSTRVLPFEEARATGAVHMFGEKYGGEVRVLSAADSLEFCGGTHCRATGDIGSMRITAERSVGSGVRRIEAITGFGAVSAFQEDRRRLAEAASEIERLKKEVAKAAKAAAVGAAAPVLDPLAAERTSPGSGKVACAILSADGASGDALMKAGDRVKDDSGDALGVLLHSVDKGGVVLVAAGNSAAREAGFQAGKAVQAAAKALGGGGGGRPDMARGKGKDPTRLPDAVAAFSAYVGEL